MFQQVANEVNSVQVQSGEPQPQYEHPYLPIQRVEGRIFKKYHQRKHFGEPFTGNYDDDFLMLIKKVFKDTQQPTEVGPNLVVFQRHALDYIAMLQYHYPNDQSMNKEKPFRFIKAEKIDLSDQQLELFFRTMILLRNRTNEWRNANSKPLYKFTNIQFWLVGGAATPTYNWSCGWFKATIQKESDMPVKLWMLTPPHRTVGPVYAPTSTEFQHDRAKDHPVTGCVFFYRVCFVVALHSIFKKLTGHSDLTLYSVYRVFCNQFSPEQAVRAFDQGKHIECILRYFINTLEAFTKPDDLDYETLIGDLIGYHDSVAQRAEVNQITQIKQKCPDPTIVYYDPENSDYGFADQSNDISYSVDASVDFEYLPFAAAAVSHTTNIGYDGIWQHKDFKRLRKVNDQCKYLHCLRQEAAQVVAKKLETSTIQLNQQCTKLNMYFRSIINEFYRKNNLVSLKCQDDFDWIRGLASRTFKIEISVPPAVIKIEGQALNTDRIWQALNENQVIITRWYRYNMSQLKCWKTSFDTEWPKFYEPLLMKEMEKRQAYEAVGSHYIHPFKTDYRKVCIDKAIQTDKEAPNLDSIYKQASLVGYLTRRQVDSDSEESLGETPARRRRLSDSSEAQIPQNPPRPELRVTVTPDQTQISGILKPIRVPKGSEKSSLDAVFADPSIARAWEDFKIQNWTMIWGCQSPEEVSVCYQRERDPFAMATNAYTEVPAVCKFEEGVTEVVDAAYLGFLLQAAELSTMSLTSLLIAKGLFLHIKYVTTLSIEDRETMKEYYSQSCYRFDPEEWPDDVVRVICRLDVHEIVQPEFNISVFSQKSYYSIRLNSSNRAEWMIQIIHPMLSECQEGQYYALVTLYVLSGDGPEASVEERNVRLVVEAAGHLRVYCAAWERIQSLDVRQISLI